MGRGERGGASGAGDSTRTLPMMMVETRDKGLNKSRRSYSGKKEMRKEWKERKRRRETEREGRWEFLGTYTAPEGSGRLGWP